MENRSTYLGGGGGGGGGRGGGNNTVKKLWKNTKVAPRQHKSLAVVISHCSNNEGQWLLAQTTPTPG